MAAWATTADVTEVTGAAVDAASVARAQLIVELFVGRTADAPGLLNRDLLWLKRAVAYQAAWMADRPNLWEQMETTMVSQDGLTARIEAAAQLLGPLPRRCLKRLSWRGNRSISVDSAFTSGTERAFYPAALGVAGVYDSEDHPTWPDDPWSPM